VDESPRNEDVLLKMNVDPLIALIAEDRFSIAYRPRLVKIAGSVTAAILLQQTLFHWRTSNYQSFYKFKEPCDHPFYREGDSWTEELGFSRREFDTALKLIGYKVSKKKNAPDETEGVYVGYKIEIDRITWYIPHEENIKRALWEIYQERYGNHPAKPEIDVTAQNAFTKSANPPLRNGAKRLYDNFVEDASQTLSAKEDERNNRNGGIRLYEKADSAFRYTETNRSEISEILIHTHTQDHDLPTRAYAREKNPVPTDHVERFVDFVVNNYPGKIKTTSGFKHAIRRKLNDDELEDFDKFWQGYRIELIRDWLYKNIPEFDLDGEKFVFNGTIDTDGKGNVIALCGDRWFILSDETLKKMNLPQANVEFQKTPEKQGA
jgi:hypothetical protein